MLSPHLSFFFFTTYCLLSQNVSFAPIICLLHCLANVKIALFYSLFPIRSNAAAESLKAALKAAAKDPVNAFNE